MRRVKTAAGWAAGMALVAALGVAAPRVAGQENAGERDPDGPLVRAFELADMSGGQIGVTVREADAADTKNKQGIQVGSVIVDDVREDSPADRAGVREGDVILEWDGERVRSARQFKRLVEETARGRSAPLVLSRNGSRTELSVTPEGSDLGRMHQGLRMDPPVVAAVPRLPSFEAFDRFERFAPEIEIWSGRQGRLGVQIETLTDQLADHLGVKHGVLVTSVAADTPAARAGIKAGDVITAIDGGAVEDAADIRRQLRAIEDDREFAVAITRERKPLTLKARLEPRRSSDRRTITF